jgi:hypothetical protein
MRFNYAFIMFIGVFSLPVCTSAFLFLPKGNKGLQPNPVAEYFIYYYPIFSPALSNYYAHDRG